MSLRVKIMDKADKDFVPHRVYGIRRKGAKAIFFKKMAGILPLACEGAKGAGRDSSCWSGTWLGRIGGQVLASSATPVNRTAGVVQTQGDRPNKA